MNDVKDELIRRNTVWYTRPCSVCGRKFPKSYIKPIRKEEWEDIDFCPEHNPFKRDD